MIIKTFITIGIAGFEPATSCSQSTRSTKLSHIPLINHEALADGPLQNKILFSEFYPDSKVSLMIVSVCLVS